ncbi:prolyl oligopeptidase [Fimicolochytrium jonesii]|uniref:prolyl oligopeptidase n=1 Tax=Fimicolochytrium jonesii TaxID=1396493 RepID=UPI0022FEA404|nr:prolyl oligopeptidase [Fimicolochytrium jonesii]KAI8823638.1 prolyl oligopeptidase [Fimicolochytrium jonesii]
MSSSATANGPFGYPSVRRDDTVETLHGHKVADPYRWLEDPDSEETKVFVEAQNKLFFDYIGNYPKRETFKQKLTNLWNFEKFGCPFKRGDKYYYFHNSGLQAQSVLYQQESLDAEAKTFLDPNKLSDDGTVSLNTYGFSKSGKFFAYGLSASGSDWVSVHVRETQPGSKENYEEKPLEWAKFTGLEWTHDDKGFFYSRYPKPERDTDKGTETDSNKNAALYYHKIGTPQSQDIVIFKPEDPEHMVGAEVSDDGKYLVITVIRGCDPERKLYIVDFAKTFAKTGKEEVTGDFEMIKVVDEFTAEWDYVANEGTVFWFQTTLEAPKRRIVKYDLAHPEKGFAEVIAQSEDVLTQARVVNEDKLILVYLHDVKHVARLHALHTGKDLEPKELPLPLGSIIGSLSGRKEDKEIFYSFSSFITPGSIHRYDFETSKHSVFRETKVNGLKADILETKQIFFTSKDGTKVPMYIISRKDAKQDSNNATLLYAYGGFNISITPSFAVTWLNFIQHMKGVVAVANIRGGGEYGQEAWYDQGKLGKKQNVFDDFQAAAKYLIDNKWTKPDKLAINGGSNGGLLVGASINQAPELFGCAIADVGVMDMYRFHKFTIGHAWVSDYGNPDKKEDFEVVRKYSPLHNVQKDKPYPAVLITTGDHDDRVVPLHSHKLLATLQHEARNNAKPILERVETKAGHGAGKSTAQRIEEATDKFSFLALALDHHVWED